MWFKNLLQGLAVLAASLLFGCASVGDRVDIPITMPRGEKATIVAHKQSVPDWLLAADGRKLNYLVRGSVTPEQLEAVARVQDACRVYANTVRPHELIGVISAGVIYGLAGYIGVGQGAAAAFTGASRSDYGTYGGWASGMGGLANGVVQSGGRTYTFENCGREVFDMFPAYSVRILQKSPY